MINHTKQIQCFCAPWGASAGPLVSRFLRSMRMIGGNHCTTTTTKLQDSRMHQPDMQVGDSDTLRRWRLELGLTQKELGELLGTHKLHIAGQEKGRRSIRKATINHLALIYAVNSLPPDAPVSIIQETLAPPSVIRKRQNAMQRLKTKPQKRR